MHPGVRVALGAAALAACSRAEPLTGAAVDAAEGRWRANALDSYVLTLKVDGDRVESGELRSVVERGVVTELWRDGVAVTSRDPFYTVPGLFDLLRDELEMAAAPEKYWGVPAGSLVQQRAQFDAARGYPVRYLRAVSGTRHAVAVVVRSLEARP